MAIVTNFSTSSSIKSALSYGSNSEKLGDTIGLNCSENSEEAVRDFELPFKINERENDRVKINRFVLSFANNENNGKSELNQFDANDYVRKFLIKFNDKMLNNRYPIIAFEHLNTNHNHYHIYFPSLSITGKKFHPKLNPMFQARKINDVLSREYHLKSIQEYKPNLKHQFTRQQLFNYSRKHNDRLPYSYKDHARYIISNAVFSSHNMYDFDYYMKKLGGGIAGNFYSNTKVGSIYIPFIYKDFHRKVNQVSRKVRTKTLGSDFTKDKLKVAIQSNNPEVLNRYKPYLKKPVTVIGGKYHDYYSFPKNSNSLDRMKGVNFKDEGFDSAQKIRADAGASSRLQKEIDRNSKRINDSSEHVHKCISTESEISRKFGQHSSEFGRISVETPGFKELSKEDKQEMIAFARCCANVQEAADVLVDIISDITHDAYKLIDKPIDSFLKNAYKKVSGDDLNQKPEMKFDYSNNSQKQDNQNDSGYESTIYQSNNDVSNNPSINNVNRNRKNLKYDNDYKKSGLDQEQEKPAAEQNFNTHNVSVAPKGMSGKEYVRKFKARIHARQAKRRKDAKIFNRKFDEKERKQRKAENAKKDKNIKRKRRILQYKKRNSMKFY